MASKMKWTGVTILRVFLVVGTMLNALQSAMASQSPRRECCGVPYDVAVARKQNNTMSNPEDGAQPSRVIPSCLEAHKSCIGHFDCRSTLRSVQLLCGQETVACSAPEVALCRAALRALMRFSFYQPTCLCREPHLDAHCTIVRNFVFDHPCLLPGLAIERATDPQRTYRDEDASGDLHTCSESLRRCQNDAECFEAYQEFIQSCDYAGGYCSREKCFRAWERLRRFAIIGCTCNRRNSHVSAACLSVYRFVNENPCMRALMSRKDKPAAVPAVLHGTRHEGRMSPPRDVRPLSIFSEVFGPIRSLIVADGEDDIAEGKVIDGEFSQRLDDYGGDSVPLTTPRTSVASSSKFESREAEEPEETSSQVVFNLLLAGDSPSYTDTGSSDEDPLSGMAFSSRGQFSSSGDSADDEVNRRSFALSSCFTTAESCLKMRSCRGPLELYLTSCRRSACHDDVCAAKAQEFFSAASEPASTKSLEELTDIAKGIKNSVETKGDLVRNVAFCSCPSGDERCRQVLENLAPVCFVEQSFSDISAPKCHALVQVCREDPSCRATLEDYVHQCATDAMNGLCMRESSACLTAALNLMRSRAFRACSCSGVHYADFLACNDWKRLLWSNPCVEQSRQSYWRQQEAARAISAGSEMNFADGASVQSHPEAISKSTVTEHDTAGSKDPVEVAILANSGFQSSHFDNRRPEEHEYEEFSSDTTPTPLENRRIAHGPKENRKKERSQEPENKSSEDRNFRFAEEDGADVKRKNDDQDGVDSVDTNLNEAAPTMGSDESTYSRVDGVMYNRGRQHAPVEHKKGYCVVENGDGLTQDAFLSVGESIRVYDPLTEGRCSEVCNCTSEGAVKCRVLGCLRSEPCDEHDAKQELTVGYHLGPSDDSSVLRNKDERGPCVCSAGKQICARPPSEIAHGLGRSYLVQELTPLFSLMPAMKITRKGPSFLSLGYDSSEELLFRGVMRVSMRDASIALQEVYDDLQLRNVNTISCVLVPFRTFSAENFIMEIRPTFDASFDGKRAQEECDSLAVTLATMITNRDRKIIRHPILSLLRVAQVLNYSQRIGSGNRQTINGTEGQPARNPGAIWDHQASSSSIFNSAASHVYSGRAFLAAASLLTTIASPRELLEVIAFVAATLKSASPPVPRRIPVTLLMSPFSLWIFTMLDESAEWMIAR